jgi:peroxiredoxin
MKKIFIIISLIAAVTSAGAQIKMNNLTFKTADGKVIPADKLDSVKNTMGPNVQFMHRESEPGVMYLIVQSSASQQAETASKQKFEAMMGKRAPHFNVIDVNGKKYDLMALKGKVVVLNFWFIHCSGCVAEMPDLNKIKAAYGPDKVVFIAFSLDKKQEIRNFLKRTPFRYALIPQARKTHDQYGIYACPVSMVIDRNGILRFISEAGEHVEKKLPEAINAALR